MTSRIVLAVVAVIFIGNLNASAIDCPGDTTVISPCSSGVAVNYAPNGCPPGFNCYPPTGAVFTPGTHLVKCGDGVDSSHSRSQRPPGQ